MGQAYMSNPIDKELDQGYSICFCGLGVKLHQAGFDCKTHFCTECHEHVADKQDFFMTTGAEVLSK